jgi:WD40 repeat protein
MSLAKAHFLTRVLLAMLALAGVGHVLAAGPLQDNAVAKLDLYGDPLPPRALVRLGTVRFRHGTLGANFLPDSKTVVAATQSNSIHFWDARSGRLVKAIDTGPLTINQHCVLSGNRKRIAVSGWLAEAQGGGRQVIRVFDTASGKEVRTFDRESRDGVGALALTTDGDLLLSIGTSGALRIEEIASGVELLRQQFPGDVMAHMALSPDGKTVALGSGPNSRKLFLWKWQSGDEPRELPGPERPGQSLAFSPDGKILAEAGDIDPTVRLWDVDRGQILYRLEAPDHEYYRHYLAFSSDGKTLACAGLDNEGGGVHLWDTKSGKLQKQLPLRAGALAFSPDGQLLAVGRRVWDFAAGKEISVNEAAHTQDFFPRTCRR